MQEFVLEEKFTTQLKEKWVDNMVLKYHIESTLKS